MVKIVDNQVFLIREDLKIGPFTEAELGDIHFFKNRSYIYEEIDNVLNEDYRESGFEVTAEIRSLINEKSYHKYLKYEPSEMDDIRMAVRESLIEEKLI